MYQKGKKIKMDQRTKAESDPAVAAASILARAGFLMALRKMEKDFGIETVPKGCSAKVKQIAAELVALVSRVAPDLAAKVRQGWGSVNFRHRRAGFVCAVFPSADRVLLLFEHGRELSHPLLVDNGKVKQVRWIPFAPGDAIPEDEIAILIAEAIALRA